MRNWALPGIAMVMLVLGVLVMRSISNMGGSGAVAAAGFVIPPESVLKGLNVRFLEGALNAGGLPTLADGSVGISADAAISAAINHGVGVADGKPLPDTQTSPTFGLFSDDIMATRLPSGEKQLLYQNRPVWMVTFSGPSIELPAAGPPAPDGRVRAHHAMTVVIDAITGEYLEAFDF